MFWAFSILFHIGIWLFDFSFVVTFVISRFCLSVIGVLWRPFPSRGFCQMGYLAPTNWSLQLETQGLLFPSSANIVCGREPCLTTMFTLFFFWLTFFFFSDVSSFFHIVPYRNLTVWFDCHFRVILILFVSYWGPMEATFSSWILSSGLNCAPELRTSNFKHKDCLFPSRANLVCGKQRCSTTCIFFQILLTS